MFFKIGALQNFTNLGSNFSNVAGLICCNFIKKRIQRRCFPVKFAKFLITRFFPEHLQWLVPRLSGRPRLCELNWSIETPAQAFYCEFCEIFKNIMDHLRWLLLSVTRCKTSKYTCFMQCAHSLMVSIVSEATGFYLLQRRT